MTEEMSLIPAMLVTFFLMTGSALTLVGSLGLVWFSNFFDRLHMSALISSGGSCLILIASMIYASVQQGRPVLHDLLIAIFLFITVPVTVMMVSQSARLRDKTKNWQNPDALSPPIKKIKIKNKP